MIKNIKKFDLMVKVLFASVGNRESFLRGYYDGISRRPGKEDFNISGLSGCSVCGVYLNACLRRSLMKYLIPFLKVSN